MSVIIPAHNAHSTLAEALDSVIAQGYESWEAIVADDASSDGTGELAAGYHPRVKCVRTPRNLGAGGARNLALANAGGELVAMLDADDVWLPHYLERQVARYDEALAAGEPVGIVCCDTYEVDARGTRDRTFFQRIEWDRPPTLSTLLRNNTIFVSALVPRRLIEELGGFATNCIGTEDYDLWVRILESGRTVVTVPEPLALYRRGEGSVSANLAHMARETQMVYGRALERGRLDAHQRAIVHRGLRLQRLIELWQDARSKRVATGRLPWGQIVRATPLGVRVVLERPERWPHLLRHGLSIARRG